SLCRRYQKADIAVAQDVGDLARLQHGIYRHKDATGRRHSQHSDHCLEALFEIDADSLASCEAERGERIGRSLALTPQGLIIEGLPAIAERDPVGLATGCFLDKMMN